MIIIRPVYRGEGIEKQKNICYIFNKKGKRNLLIIIRPVDRGEGRLTDRKMSVIF